MSRYTLLDGLRGYFLVFMMINHLDFIGGAVIAKFNHAELGYVQDAQGFVFLSGLIVGLYYARLYAKGRSAEAAAKIRRRAGELYRYAVAILVSILLIALLMPETRLYWGTRLGAFYDAPASTALSAMLLVFQPTFMDILPQYILYLLVSPLLIGLVVAGRWRTVAVGSVALWLAVQFGMHLPLLEALGHTVQTVSPDSPLRGHFNPLAWQIVFVGGLLIGAAFSEGRFELRRWFPAERGPVLLAAGTVLFFALWRFGFDYGVVPAEMGERFWAYASRGDFGLVYLANFVALAYLVAWLLIAGHEAANRWVRGIAAILERVFSLPFLVLLGRHSLMVYTFHVFVAYGAKALEWRHGGFTEWEKALVVAVAVASLALPALFQEWRSQPARAMRSQRTA
ncbi:MAG TPA: OpgC domain-containing protein [Alphaproteobacteria bacterium]|nr:OpgC domain-containing protein [Alphaproteobacteria bacterium]